MAATLNILNNFNFSGANTAAGPTMGWQGPAIGLPGTALNVGSVAGLLSSATSLTGLHYYDTGTLATATALKIYDSSVFKPATFNYAWIWVDQQPSALQFITSATNFSVNMLPGVPFTLSLNTILAAANTTPIGSSAPSTTAVATIYIGNYSGNPMNWQIALFL